MAGKDNTKSFLVHGSILAFASILCRIIGIIYRIPLTNILGDKGIGYYSAAFQVYSILLLLSSYSMPLAVSKLISTHVAKGEYRNANKIFRDAAIFSVSVGSIVALITYFGAEKFASFTKYTHSSIALRMLAPTLVIMSVVGVLRGYFQGMGTMIPTAFSNILEQISNAIVSVVAAKFLFDYGCTLNNSKNADYYDVAWGAAGGTMGTGVGALFALIFLVFTFSLFRTVYARKVRRDRRSRILDHRQIGKLIIITIIPVILSTTIYNISEIIDSTIFGNIMHSVKQMSEDDYSSLYGMFSGKYRLMTNVPVSIAASLASAIIPSLIASYSVGDKGQVLVKIESSLRFTMIFAIPSAIGMFALAEPIMGLLFSGNKQVPGIMLKVGALSIIFYSISTITNSILQGIDKMRVPIINSLIALVIHIVILVTLLVTTNLSIYAVVIADVIFPLVICILNAISIYRYVGYRQEYVKTFIKPGISALVMGVVAYVVYSGTYMMLPVNAIATLVSIMFAVVTYALMSLVTGSVDEKELYSFPKGDKIVALLKKLYLM